MKKTGLDALTILYQLVANSPLKTAITGGVYKLKRPLNSTQEDVVLNVLSFSADQLQRGTANANIYVPDTTAKLNTQEQGRPDLIRLQVLVDLATALFAERYSSQYNFWLTNVAILDEPNTGQTYANLRIDFQFFP